MKVGLPMTDLSTALYAHGAVMAALLNRHRTGNGQKLQCNLLQTQVHSCEMCFRLYSLLLRDECF